MYIDKYSLLHISTLAPLASHCMGKLILESFVRSCRPLSIYNNIMHDIVINEKIAHMQAACNYK